MTPLLVFLLVAAATASPATLPKASYHETHGIREATRIKQSEEARDFDGARIVGGYPAYLGQHPYFGGLLISLQGDYTSVCGSSLLTNTRALTAAQCWYDGYYQAVSLTVVLGSVFLFSGGTRVTSSTVVVHEGWDPYRNINDIAVIQLPYVAFTEYIRPINLPSYTYDSYVGVGAQVVGFGYQSDSGSITAAQYLSQVTVSVMSNFDCAQYYPAYVFDSTICTSGAERRGPCISDNGGPLSYYYYGQRVLIGVSQFVSVFGCEIGYPAGYSRVTYYLPWILQRLY